MKKFIVIIAFVLLFLGIGYLYNTEQRKLEGNFVSSANEMNRAIEDANRGIDYANEMIGEHKKAICDLATYKLQKLVPNTDEELKQKVIANCEVIPEFVDTGWGLDFALEISNRDNPL